jgi:hypothetical protein
MFIIYERTLLSTDFVGQKRAGVCDCPPAHLRSWDFNGAGMKPIPRAAGRTVGNSSGRGEGAGVAIKPPVLREPSLILIITGSRIY